MIIPNEGKVLLDFYADWCGPCRAMTPVLEQFKNASGVPLIKINVDIERSLAEEFGIRGIPCFVYLEDGRTKAKAVGMQSLQQLKKLCA